MLFNDDRTGPFSPRIWESPTQTKSSPSAIIDLHFARQFGARRSDHSLRLDATWSEIEFRAIAAKLKALNPLEEFSSQSADQPPSGHLFHYLPATASSAFEGVGEEKARVDGVRVLLITEDLASPKKN